MVKTEDSEQVKEERDRLFQVNGILIPQEGN